MAWAVNPMIGIAPEAGLVLIMRAAVQPSITGRFMSSNTMSGISAAT